MYKKAHSSLYLTFLIRKVMKNEIAHTVQKLVLLSRIELESFGYRPSALPLSYRSKNYWKGYTESNRDCWGQIPECYHYTIPHHLNWRPLPDSNWDLNLRRISFYPVELRGHKSGTPTRIQTLITNSVGLRVIQLHYRCIKMVLHLGLEPKTFRLKAGYSSQLS